MKNMLIWIVVGVLAYTTGCVSTVAKTNRKTFPDGTVSLSSYVSVKGTGDKAATLAAEGLFADGNVDDLGAGVRNAVATQESSGVADTLRGVGELLTGLGNVVTPLAAVRAGTAAAVAVPGGDTDTDYTFADSTTESTTYSSEGYSGTPGANGVGVYGRPSCGNCRSYHAAHPDVEIINIDVAANRAAMWDAVRARGFVGTNITLPVLVTDTAYTARAR